MKKLLLIGLLIASYGAANAQTITVNNTTGCPAIPGRLFADWPGEASLVGPCCPPSSCPGGAITSSNSAAFTILPGTHVYNYSSLTWSYGTTPAQIDMANAFNSSGPALGVEHNLICQSGGAIQNKITSVVNCPGATLEMSTDAS